MAFWGTYVRPNDVCVLRVDQRGRRLRISQAVLAEQIEDGNSTTLLTCSVGSNPSILICLLSKENQSCPLNLEFQEQEDVYFETVGSIGVFLSGAYVSQCASCVTSGHRLGVHKAKHFYDKTNKEEATDLEDLLVKTTEANNGKRKLSVTKEAENKKDEDIMAVEDYSDFSDYFIEDIVQPFSPSGLELPGAKVVTNIMVESGKPKKRKTSSDQQKGKQSIGCDTEATSKRKQQTITSGINFGRVENYKFTHSITFGLTKRKGMKSQIKKLEQDGSNSGGIATKEQVKGESNGKKATQRKIFECP